MYKRSGKQLVLLFILCLTLLFAGCSRLSKRGQEQNAFDSFMNNLFIKEVQTDTLSLNYSLAHPENYGIKDDKVTLGDYGINSMKEDLISSENYLGRLQSFDYMLLNSDQQLTYEIVKNYLSDELAFGDFMYYGECLGPTTGIQAQLPILLAEFSFYDKSDIDDYLKLLLCVNDYFEDIILYEQEKSKHGLFMSDKVAQRIIEQCKAFVKEPEKNFLIQNFDERISDYKGLTKAEKSGYKAKNKEAVICHVLPAYKNLISALKELKGTGTNKAGLYYYPEGQAYYECLAKSKTGSGRSMEEMIRLLEDAIDKGVADLTGLTQSDPSLIDKYLSFSSFPITDPNDILTDLKMDMKKDFPAAVNVNCEIKYVPASLEDYLSPAMYLVPPIDSYRNNNIYINGNNKKTLSLIYTTIAHEGYPGHLYQCVYFRNIEPSPIRNLLNFVGYDEGWATYVEMYSYHLAGIDEYLAEFLGKNNMVILCMYARADIGIHYQGWTKSKAVNFIGQYINDEEIAGSIYDTLLEEPAIYLPYAVGYLEIEKLKEKAELELGDRFITKDFHEFLLNIGPAPFDVIEEHMLLWIKNHP